MANKRHEKNRNLPSNAVVTTGNPLNEKETQSLINKVRDVGISRSNDEIVKVLESCDYNVEATISAFSENKADTVLSSWQVRGKKNKKKNSNRKKQKEVADKPEINASTNSYVVNGNGVSDKKSEDEEQQIIKKLCDTKLNNSAADENITNVNINVKSEQKLTVEDSATAPSSNHKIPVDSTPIADKSLSSTNESSKQPSPPPIKRNSSRPCSDLRRHSSLLSRTETNLSYEIDQSNNRIRKVFAMLRSKLDDREAELKQDLDNSKSKALDLLSSRLENLHHYENESKKSTTMSDEEFKFFKEGVKSLVGDRILDENLGKSASFTYFQTNLDNLTKLISEFGEVSPVDICYKQPGSRSMSVSSTSSLQIDTEACAGMQGTVASSPSSVTSSLSGLSSNATEPSSATSASIPSSSRQYVNDHPQRKQYARGAYRSNSFTRSYGSGGRNRGRGRGNYRNSQNSNFSRSASLYETSIGHKNV